MIQNSGITSFNRTFSCPIICTDSIHNVILVIDTSNNASYNQVYWCVGRPYLSIKVSNARGTFSQKKLQLIQNILVIKIYYRRLPYLEDKEITSIVPRQCSFTPHRPKMRILHKPMVTQHIKEMAGHPGQFPGIANF